MVVAWGDDAAEKSECSRGLDGCMLRERPIFGPLADRDFCGYQDGSHSTGFETLLRPWTGSSCSSPPGWRHPRLHERDWWTPTPTRKRGDSLLETFVTAMDAGSIQFDHSVLW